MDIIILKQLEEWGIDFMETNRKRKSVRRVFIIFVISLISCFVMFYYSVIALYQQGINTFIVRLRNLYPEVTISTALFTQNFTLSYNWYFITLMVIMIISLIYIYRYVMNAHKTYTKDINHIISEIDADDFVPSSLEGELSLLEEKIFNYKNRNDKLIEKIEKEKKQISDYIENIAHQIKTPISTIRLNEEMTVLAGDVSLLEKNKSSFERLDNLFDNFMKLSRIENDTIHFNLELGSINELLNDVEELVSPLLKKTELIIESADVSFFYDDQWLSEAIYNIVKNCVEEDVTQIHIKTIYNNEMIHILICDNGKGINEEDLPYIFERFYRSSKNKKSGVGIGLALCKEIVLKHHGFINAYNENGAVFDLSFPMIDVKEKVI